MGFRTVAISQAVEIHIKEGQLEITTAEGNICVPIEDVCQIMVLDIAVHRNIGSNVGLSLGERVA